MDEELRANQIAGLAPDVEAVLKAPLTQFGTARPPNTTGVYLFWADGQLVYAGKANGKKGLKDRMAKHISGDEGHAVQRALEERFPDRSERRNYVKNAVSVRWHVIEDKWRASAVEGLLIWLLRPPWNRTEKE